MAVPRAAAPARPAAATLTRSAEAAALAIAGAMLAALTWRVVDLAAPAAVVAALNGAISGWRRIYRWWSPSGPLAFVLDSSWALLTTTAALVAHAVAAGQRRRGGYIAALSERSDRHVYTDGLRIRPGFLLTTGNVVSGAGRAARRQQAVIRHEHVHVWQARWLGPLFPALYGTWTVLAATAGVGFWALTGRRKRLWNVVDTWAYYSNPLEWWAYSREGRWPPPGAEPRLTWRRPIV